MISKLDVLNDIYCPINPEKPPLCNQVITNPKKEIRALFTAIYLIIGTAMRYLVPLLLNLFFFPDISYIVFMSMPFITLVGYGVVYTLTANVTWLVVNIILCVAFYVVAFQAIGFHALPPLLLTVIVSLFTFPQFDPIIQMVGIVAAIMVNFVPWEVFTILLLNKKQKKISG